MFITDVPFPPYSYTASPPYAIHDDPYSFQPSAMLKGLSEVDVLWGRTGVRRGMFCFWAGLAAVAGATFFDIGNASHHRFELL